MSRRLCPSLAPWAPALRSYGLWPFVHGLCVLGFLALPAAAQYAPALSYNRAEVSVHTSAAVLRTMGWEFVAQQNLEVTALGVFDCELAFAPQGGLATAKQMGIWDASQNLLVSATIPAGQGGALCQDGFRYVAVSPTILVAGQSYVVAALWPEDDGSDNFDDFPDLQNSGAPVAFHPDVAFVQPRYKLFTPTLAFPDGTLPGFHSFLGAVDFRIGPGQCEPNPPADLVTTFASDNGWAGNMFDLRATHSAGLTVDAWQVNLGDVVPQDALIEVSIYWRHGSYAAATDSSAGWNLLGSAAVRSWGTNQPTPVPLGGLVLPYDQVVGVYVLLSQWTEDPPQANVPLLNYTGIGPAAPSYSGGGLVLTGGVGKGGPPFTGGTAPDRMWNGGVLHHVGGTWFESFCAGDGSGTPCPCGNSGPAGHGCANATGHAALLGAVGTNSVGAGGPTLLGSGLVPAEPVLFFQGDNALGAGQGTPFGDGLRCVGGAVIRLEVGSADPGGNSASTVELPATGGVGPGDTKRYQLWYRDSGSSPCSAGFNLSQGLEITWAL